MLLRNYIKQLRCTTGSSFMARSTSSLSAIPKSLPDHESSGADPYSLMKQDPIEICTSLWVKSFSSPTAASFPNLTGFLSKFDLWVLAYQRSCAQVTGSFPPRSAIHTHHLRSLLSLRDAVIHCRFEWNDNMGPLIRSPNDKPLAKVLSKRKVQQILDSSEPCFQDRVVQEVLLMVLEPIFEARFSKKSYAFRPGRNAHTVIRTIRSNFAGYLWFLKGDISEILDNVDTDLVMGCLEKVVKDKKVLSLIKSGLKVPVSVSKRLKDQSNKELSRSKKKRKATKKRILNENEPKPDPYWLRTFFCFSPDETTKVASYGYCGILSPLLANICLNELDQMMEELIVTYFKPCELDSIWKQSIDDGCHNPSWPEFVPSSGSEKTRKMNYIRYGGHFLIGIRGPREDAVSIRKELIEFSESRYGLKLENSKVEIEHISRGIQFLDHIICHRVIYPTLRYTSSGGNIVSQKGIGTLLSVTGNLQQCIRHLRGLELVKGEKDPEPLPCTPMLYSSQSHTNAQMNKFLETMADWYRYRLKSRAKVYKIASRNLSHPLRESSNNSAPEYSELLRMGLVDAIEGIQFSRMSLIPSCDYTTFPRNWVPDHEQILHEYIRLQDPKFFYKLHKSIKHEGLNAPQDEISDIVWDAKTVGIRRSRSFL